MQSFSATWDLSVSLKNIHLVCLHKKTMEKQNSGIQKRILCEWPPQRQVQNATKPDTFTTWVSA